MAKAESSALALLADCLVDLLLAASSKKLIQLSAWVWSVACFPTAITLRLAPRIFAHAAALLDSDTFLVANSVSVTDAVLDMMLQLVSRLLDPPHAADEQCHLSPVLLNLPAWWPCLCTGLVVWDLRADNLRPLVAKASATLRAAWPLYSASSLSSSSSSSRSKLLDTVLTAIANDEAVHPGALLRPKARLGDSDVAYLALDAWILLVRVLGDALVRQPSLLNALLKLPEATFRASDPAVRASSFVPWCQLAAVLFSHASDPESKFRITKPAHAALFLKPMLDVYTHPVSAPVRAAASSALAALLALYAPVAAAATLKLFHPVIAALIASSPSPDELDLLAHIFCAILAPLPPADVPAPATPPSSWTTLTAPPPALPVTSLDSHQSFPAIDLPEHAIPAVFPLLSQLFGLAVRAATLDTLAAAWTHLARRVRLHGAAAVRPPRSHVRAVNALVSASVDLLATSNPDWPTPSRAALLVALASELGPEVLSSVFFKLTPHDDLPILRLADAACRLRHAQPQPFLPLYASLVDIALQGVLALESAAHLLATLADLSADLALDLWATLAGRLTAHLNGDVTSATTTSALAHLTTDAAELIGSVLAAPLRFYLVADPPQLAPQLIKPWSALMETSARLVALRFPATPNRSIHAFTTAAMDALRSYVAAAHASPPDSPPPPVHIPLPALDLLLPALAAALQHFAFVLPTKSRSRGLAAPGAPLARPSAPGLAPTLARTRSSDEDTRPGSGFPLSSAWLELLELAHVVLRDLIELATAAADGALPRLVAHVDSLREFSRAALVASRHVTLIFVDKFAAPMVDMLAAPKSLLRAKVTSVRGSPGTSLGAVLVNWIATVLDALAPPRVAPYDSDLLAFLAPLFQGCLMSGSTTIRNQFVSLWNATFGKAAPGGPPLVVPVGLRPILRALCNQLEAEGATPLQLVDPTALRSPPKAARAKARLAVRQAANASASSPPPLGRSDSTFAAPSPSPVFGATPSSAAPVPAFTPPRTRATLLSPRFASPSSVARFPGSMLHRSPVAATAAASTRPLARTTPSSRVRNSIEAARKLNSARKASASPINSPSPPKLHRKSSPALSDIPVTYSKLDRTTSDIQRMETTTPVDLTAAHPALPDPPSPVASSIGKKRTYAKSLAADHGEPAPPNKPGPRKRVKLLVPRDAHMLAPDLATSSALRHALPRSVPLSGIGDVASLRISDFDSSDALGSVLLHNVRAFLERERAVRESAGLSSIRRPAAAAAAPNPSSTERMVSVFVPGVKRGKRVLISDLSSFDALYDRLTSLFPGLSKQTLASANSSYYVDSRLNELDIDASLKWSQLVADDVRELHIE
ncbi:uncharacterized protein AMSG_00544 [Thecamonas trahens ATCC 50062]|uniref:Telomere-associated protein Rif1 N-terminal domain-containing protein n=1 Tax=Thecamonas trahens ATCC 50062 TaxID=461836 RepID=A0A0L0D8R0_THETB|nr:hypothetical protein AMSG_00544 [Thecamonas trahens ATCC 50062]KNC48767.1 hypothetical protein AMSG_00544 [Thecamonas trahens ATCC 50062]|eukprot:XP_013762818.1 hypothetical protein AMSG_00544 [Thecamonas trahens ATCC 50062]